VDGVVRVSSPSASLGSAQGSHTRGHSLRAWLDSWTGLGALVVGMRHHGYELRLDSDENGWRASFLHWSHVLYPWSGKCSTGAPHRGVRCKAPRVADAEHAVRSGLLAQPRGVSRV